MNSIKSGEPSVTILLGAGASKDAGLLLSADLTDELQKDARNSGEADLLRALGLILGALAFKRGVDGDKIDSRVDIETVLRVASQLADRAKHPITSFVASWHASLERLAPNGNSVVFERLVNRARQLLKDALKVPEDPSKVLYLGQLIRLETFGTAKRYPQVFTLNYDRCLEMGLKYENVPFTTGFLDGRWDRSQLERDDCLRVYKLHGSFGWVRHPETGVIYDVEASLDRADIDIASYDVEDELVFGTENKLQARQPFLWMVYRFSEAVHAAKYIVCIGYGFADAYINQILAQAMAEDPAKRLIAVGPDLTEALLEQADGLQFSPNRTSIIPEKAKPALTDTDSIRKAIQKFEKTLKDEAPFGA